MTSLEAAPAVGQAVGAAEPARIKEVAPVHLAQLGDAHLEADPPTLRGEPLRILEQAAADAAGAGVGEHRELLDRPRDALEAQHRAARERQKPHNAVGLFDTDKNERARVVEQAPK